MCVLVLPEGGGHHLLGDEDFAEHPHLRFEFARDLEVRVRLRLAQQAEGVADFEVVGGGEMVGDDRFVVGQMPQLRRAAPQPFDFDPFFDVRRRPVHFHRAAAPAGDLRGGGADRRHRPSPRAPSRRRSAAPAGIGEKPSEFSITRPPAKFSSITWATEALQPGGEDGDEGDQRERDHQRRGGDRGAARVALRVLAGEAAGQPAQPLQRPTDDVGEGSAPGCGLNSETATTTASPPPPIRAARAPIPPPPASPATTKATPIA